jgi:coniferyl-aldehyde dehydrogenase
MQFYLKDALKKGATVTSLGDLDSKEKNTISTKLIFGVNDTMEVMKNEIFGPLLPVMLYENLSEVVDYINKHDHPLGLYFFGKNKSQQDYIINNTRSGGVTINDTMFHLLQSRLPFGGVGSSGYGYYHGYEGFLNFSNLRSIYHQTSYDTILSLIRPPRGRLFNLLSNIMRRLG